jgi:hypothetical protein
MNRKIPGTLGLIFGTIAFLVGTFSFSQVSYYLAAGYLLVCLFAGMLIVRVFCASCPMKGTCVHILPGYVAQFWNQLPGPYSSGKIILTGILFAIIILIPQLVLIRSLYLFVLFWICIIIAAMSSYLVLCPGCGNQYCPFRREKKEQR